jgi:DtxR family transcriptional regulator, Mn-dependent transcriptional regulator
MKRQPRQRRPIGSIDRYLHALALLTDHGHQADTGELAESLGVSDAAASRMLRTLAKKNLVRLEPYQGAELTAEGLRRALDVVRRQRLLEVYLHRVLEFDLAESEARALLMMPTIDEVFADRLEALLGSPRLDPHGRPIPGRSAEQPKAEDVAKSKRKAS